MTTPVAQRSPLPWIVIRDVDSDGRQTGYARVWSADPAIGVVLDRVTVEDAEFIVTAVNAHTALVEALQGMLDQPETPEAYDAMMARARAALQLAGVETK